MLFQEPTADSIRNLLHAMEGRRVLVVGDAMLDRYIYGKSSRISPEAPVQIVQAEREENLLGGAANVAKCLVALGAKVTLGCIVGDDSAGEEFIREAQSLGIDVHLVFRDSLRPTSVKTRIICGRQHILRVDREGLTPYPQARLDDMIAGLRAAAADVDAILISDYAKGVLTESVCATAIEIAGSRPVLVDPKGDNWERYRGATVIKPNWREAITFLNARDSSTRLLTPSSDDVVSEAVAQQLLGALRVKNALVTRSEYGLSLAGSDGEHLSFRARAPKVEDEAGAGDVVAAVTCLALASGAPMAEAVWVANIAAGVKVGKFGTHTVSDHEILEALGEKFLKSERKIMSPTCAAQMAAELRRAGKKVVFTNGCFDILHLGHTLYLERARLLGDALIVGINTDASVKRLKGPERPVNSEDDRARVISAMGCVDAVVLFGEDTPIELLKAIKPDVLCKGADYKCKEDVIGWEIIEANGGRVALIELVAGRSTSKTIDQMSHRGHRGFYF
ncbi:MAG: D-glycero-beta-D-manno-heptose 1-phosphate adenylyltransferase [Planctomycetota bacterium]